MVEQLGNVYILASLDIITSRNNDVIVRNKYLQESPLEVYSNVMKLDNLKYNYSLTKDIGKIITDKCQCGRLEALSLKVELPYELEMFKCLLLI